MPLRYGLLPNHLTEDPNDYMGIVTENDTVSTEQIVELMTGKGSTLTPAEVIAVVEEFNYTIVDLVSKGNNVNTELFKIYPSIGGVFNGSSDSFTPGRHTVKLNMNAGSRLAKAVDNIELRKVEVQATVPIIKKFINLKSKSENKDFVPGQIVALQGIMLKFDEGDKKQGVFFIDSNGKETKAQNVVKNKPSELMLFAPEGLEVGDYNVEVRTILHKSKNMKTTRLIGDVACVSG